MSQKTNPTIDDIARDLGVSKTTVSRAISGKGRISQATRDKVRSYIQERNYRPNAAAKALAENKTYNLAFVIPRSFIGLDQAHVRQSMSAICEEAFLQDYNILMCLSTDDSPAPLLRILDHRKVDGVILSRTVENDCLVDILTEQGIPFATLGRLPEADRGKATVEADHDHVAGCTAFSADFLRAGQGPVALIGSDMQYMVNQSRLQGLQNAQKLCGAAENQVYIRTGVQDAAQCAQVVDQLLLSGVNRFLAMEDETCLRIASHLQERRLSIPQDVQLASLFDSEHLTNWATPISALHFDAAELGRVACRELLRFLKGLLYDPTPLLGYEIKMRKSI